MNELILKKGVRRTRVLLHNDIDQLPVEQWNRVNKFWMLHDDLGANFEDIDKLHISRLYMSMNDPAKLKKEIDNLRILIHNILNDINPLDLSFAALIHSINGEKITDYSDENLKRIIKRLSGLGLSHDTLKKKDKQIRETVYADLEMHFPDIFSNIVSVSFWSRLKLRTLSVLDSIIEGVEVNLDDTDKFFASLIQPKVFMGPQSVELRYDKGFEQNCIVLSKFTNKPVKNVSTREYFSLIQHYNKQSKRGRK
jgi:hypothetical protein